MERFIELRDRVRRGVYEVPARAVAEAILKRIMQPHTSLMDGWGETTSGGMS